MRAILIFYYNALSFLKWLLINKICVQSFYFIRICHNVFFISYVLSIGILDILLRFARSRRDRDRMVVGFTTTYENSVYHHWLLLRASCTTLCDKVYQWLATCHWLSPDTPVFSTNKTDRHIVESGVKHHSTHKYYPASNVHHECTWVMHIYKTHQKVICSHHDFVDK